MTRECHVRFWERLRGQFLRPTHHFGMKAHIGADVDSGLVHTVVTTPANESDVSQIDALLHGKETFVHGDAGYLGAQNYVARAERIEWKIARRRGEVEKIRRARERVRAMRAERRKAQIRARVEHPFLVVKCVFGYVKVRFKGLVKNSPQPVTLFALANLLMVYHFSGHDGRFALVLFRAAWLELVGVMLFHANLGQVLATLGVCLAAAILVSEIWLPAFLRPQRL